jgi:hypothetical protein
MLPDAGPKAKQGRAPLVPVAPSLDVFPALPSLVGPRPDDVPKQHKEAWLSLRAGRYDAAERGYLGILNRHPNDEKAAQGLVMVQRLLANQDREALQGQARRYRRAIAEGRVLDERYTPQEMELLARASESAANEAATESSVRLTALSKISIGRDLVHPGVAPGGVVRNAVNGVRNRIFKLASSMDLAKTGPDPASGKRPPLSPRVMNMGWSAPAANAPTGAWLRGGAGRSGAASGGLRYPVVQPAQAATTAAPASGTAGTRVVPDVGNAPVPRVSSTPDTTPTAGGPAGNAVGGPASGPPKVGGGGESSGASGNASSGSGNGGSGGGTVASPSGGGTGTSASGGGTGAVANGGGGAAGQKGKDGKDDKDGKGDKGDKDGKGGKGKGRD